MSPNSNGSTATALLRLATEASPEHGAWVAQYYAHAKPGVQSIENAAILLMLTRETQQAKPKNWRAWFRASLNRGYASRCSPAGAIRELEKCGESLHV